MPVAAKCASHAFGEFNLATPKELFSYEAKRDNLALQLVAKFSLNGWHLDYTVFICGLRPQ